MRFLVTGGRDFDNFHLVRFALLQMPETATLVHGACSGADSLCAEFWGNLNRKCEAHPADWSNCAPNCPTFPSHRGVNSRGQEFCRTAGKRRNQEMLESGGELLVAFPGGGGTADMVRRATKAGIKILDLRDSFTAGTRVNPKISRLP